MNQDNSGFLILVKGLNKYLTFVYSHLEKPLTNIGRDGEIYYLTDHPSKAFSSITSTKAEAVARMLGINYIIVNRKEL